MTSREVVDWYFEKNLRVVIWPQIGDRKGPMQEGWTQKVYTKDEYQDGNRVGLLLGHEIEPGKFLHDVDIDWGPGLPIALAFLPPTDFVFGRKGKEISHCFYTLPEPLTKFAYLDISNGKGDDKATFIELRGIADGGKLGHQTMVPPSIWSSGTLREELTFKKFKGFTHLQSAVDLKQRVCLGAIGMMFAKYFGRNGFGHEPRLAWAGFLVRAGIDPEDIITMGEQISVVCNNTEIKDVRTVVETTVRGLASPDKKIKGGASLVKILGANGRAILARINEWLGRDSEFARNKEAIIKDHTGNVSQAITKLGAQLSYNQFSDQMMIEEDGVKVQLEDPQLIDLYFRIEEKFKFRPSREFFNTVIDHLCWSNPYHPVREYFNSVTWDGTPRLDTWLQEYGGAQDNEYLRAVSSKVLIAAVRRIRTPGSKFDTMVVLESGQGRNKSTAVESLCPSEDWYLDQLPLNASAKELMELTAGKLIAEAADLAGKSKASIEQIKVFLSIRKDRSRMSYGRRAVERRRQFIIIATTNDLRYLKDPTGARRFWPVALEVFDIPRLRTDRDQLWAEAASREAAGESITLQEHLWEFAAKEQERRRRTDPWEDIIQELVDESKPGRDGCRRITKKLLWEILQIDAPRRTPELLERLNTVMTLLGYIEVTVRVPGEKPARGYKEIHPSSLGLQSDPDEDIDD